MALDEKQLRYLEVARELRKRIYNNTYPPNSYLPSQTFLADEDFKSARMTVRKAIELLEKEQLVRPIQGRGTLVLERGEDHAPDLDDEDFGDAMLAKLTELQSQVSELSVRVAQLEDRRPPEQSPEH